MASGSDVRAGGAFVEVFVKGFAATQRQLTSIGASVTKLGAGIAAVGAAIVGPLAAATKHFVDVGGPIDDMSGRLGIARTELAQLGYVADQTGSTLDDIEKAITRQRKNGSNKTFDQIAADIAAVQDPAERTRMALENWGRSGTMLLTLVDNLQELKAEARGLGIGTDEQDIKNADALGDAVAKIKSQLGAAAFNLGAALAPMLIKAADVVSGLVKHVTKWTAENRGLVRTIALVGAGLVAVGTVVAAIGSGLVFAGLAMGGLATLAGIVLSPIGLIVAAVVGIGVALAAAVGWWLKFTASGKATFAALSAAMKPFIDTLKTAFDGITKAISAGNIQLAWKILVTAMKLEWFRMVDAIVGRFLDMVKLIADNDLVRGLLGEGLGGKIDAMIAAGRGGSGAAVAALAKELAALKAEADKLEAKRLAEGGEAGAAGPDLGGGDEARATESKLVTAHSAGAAVALTYGQNRHGDLLARQLEELRFIRKKSIEQHAELLRQFRGFGPRAGR